MVQFGMMIPHFGSAAQPGMVETVAREAEALGFDSIWTGDHLIVPAGETYITNFVYDPLMVMATAAAVTERIRIGVSVLVMPYRHPIVVARMLATLDQMSGGRVILGAGVGWMEREFSALGLDVHERGARTDEHLDCIQALWDTDPTSFHGRWVQFDDMRQRPKPVQDPFPVWVGGDSPAAIRRAARRGNGWLPGNAGRAAFAEGVAAYRAACEEAGRPVGPVCMRTHMRSERTHENPEGSGPGGVRPDFTGTDEQIAADIDAFAALGADHIQFAPTVRTVDQQLEVMRRLAHEILPKVTVPRG